MNAIDSNSWAASQTRNTQRLAVWTGTWLVTLAIAVFGSSLLWPTVTWLKVAAVLLNLAVGFGMILANKQHLRGLDEMQQKVQLEAMAISLGLSLIGGLAYSTLDIVDVISFDAEISHLVFLMGVSYGLGVFFGLRKYR